MDGAVFFLRDYIQDREIGSDAPVGASVQLKSPVAGAPLIRLKALIKHHGAYIVIDGIDPQVESGKVIAIVGPSGSRKSIIQRSLNYLKPRDCGSITIGSTTIDADCPANRAELSDCVAASEWSFSLSTCFRTGWCRAIIARCRRVRLGVAA